ncbi:MAG: proteasome subunit alpha, partial [Nocardioidaceae bacterium]
ALGRDGETTRQLTASQLEVAVLDRTRAQPRKFKPLTGAVLERLLESAGISDEDGTEGDTREASEDGNDG